MNSISKEDCLMHLPVKYYISWFDREDIPFEKRYLNFGVWVSITHWNDLKSCCIECCQIIVAKLEKMNARYKKEKNQKSNFYQQIII